MIFSYWLIKQISEVPYLTVRNPLSKYRARIGRFIFTLIASLAVTATSATIYNLNSLEIGRQKEAILTTNKLQ